MKFVIIGLGNFGSSLGKELIEEGHEVIGVDNNANHVELHKDTLTFVVCTDTTEERNVEKLPFEDADFAIVSIGEDVGASLTTTALIKRHYPNTKILARGISYIHTTILETMNVFEIINPEAEYANQLAERFSLKGSHMAMAVDDDFEIAEIDAPLDFIGKRVGDLDFKGRSMQLVTILRTTEASNFLGKKVPQKRSVGIVNPATLIHENDVLVFFARYKDLQNFCNS